MTPASKVRAVQESMFPDLAPAKPIGRILPSVHTGTNADLMAAIAPYYLTGSVLDVTYGEGKWWDRYKPHPFTRHDLHKVDGVDFTDLPEADDSVDTVCFDPPYVPQGGLGGGDAEHNFRDRFGLLDESTPWTETRDLLQAGLVECCRVSSGYVLAKCSDFVTGGRFHLGHRWMLDAAPSGWECHDLIIHHTGSGPGGHNIFDPKRARRHHSYLLVFHRGVERDVVRETARPEPRTFWGRGDNNLLDNWIAGNNPHDIDPDAIDMLARLRDRNAQLWETIDELLGRGS